MKSVASKNDSEAKKGTFNRIRRNSVTTAPKLIPAEVRRLVWNDAGGECENCGSKHALEIDHIKPRSKGGSNEKENLRLLCRSCNQFAAIREFGAKKMRSYLAR